MPDYKALACTICHVGIQFHNIKDPGTSIAYFEPLLLHLKGEKHCFYGLSKPQLVKEQSLLIGELASLELAAWNTVTQELPTISKYNHSLQAASDGFFCNICAHAEQSRREMQYHMHVYSDNRMKENYSRCRVQMLFGSPNKTWIRVLMSEQSEYLAPEASQQEVYNTVHLQISRAKEELDSSRLQASAAEIELQIEHQTPWQRQTGYTNYFGHGNKDLVHPLVSLPAQHTLSATDNEMMLSNAMDSLFDKAKSSMLQRSNTVLYLFLSKDLDQAKAPWVRLGSNTEKTYQAT